MAELTIVRGQLQEKEEETANLQNQATALRQQLKGKDREMNTLEATHCPQLRMSYVNINDN